MDQLKKEKADLSLICLSIAENSELWPLCRGDIGACQGRPQGMRGTGGGSGESHIRCIKC